MNASKDKSAPDLEADNEDESGHTHRRFSNTDSTTTLSNYSSDTTDGAPLHASQQPAPAPVAATKATPIEGEEARLQDSEDEQEPSATASEERKEQRRRERQAQRRRKYISSMKGKPYSIPEPHLFGDLTRAEMPTRLYGKSEAEIPRATWFADRAGPPLLLTLDAFDTLHTPKEPVPRQYAEIASRFGYEVSEEQVQAQFKQAFKIVSEEYPHQGQGQIHYRDWWAKVIEKTFEPYKLFRRPWPDPDLTDRLYENFASKQGYHLFPDAQELLSLIGTAWAAKDWPPKRTMLGVVSNSDPRLRSILASFDVGFQDKQDPSLYPPRCAPEHYNDVPEFGPAQFSFATLSYECGHEKPSERIYDQAIVDAQKVLDAMQPWQKLTRSGKYLLESIEEEFQLLHVGDSLEKDVLPALRRGWDAVLLDRNSTELISEREAASASGKVTVINSLACLPQIVTKERLQAGLDARLGRDSVATRKPSITKDPLEDMSAIRHQRRQGRMNTTPRQAFKRLDLPSLQDASAQEEGASSANVSTESKEGSQAGVSSEGDHDSKRSEHEP